MSDTEKGITPSCQAILKYLYNQQNLIAQSTWRALTNKEDKGNPTGKMGTQFTEEENLNGQKTHKVMFTFSNNKRNAN